MKHVFTMPTPFDLYLRHKPETSCEVYIDYLTQNKAIKLINHGGYIKCKILDQTKLEQLTSYLNSKYWLFWPPRYWVRRALANPSVLMRILAN